MDGGAVQESGTVSVGPDGALTRKIIATYSSGTPLPPRGEVKAGPDGAIVRFRQTFKADGPNRVLTNGMRETDTGWVATFPGSDHLVMTRRTP